MAPGEDETTSPQRTYRYLRLALVATGIVVFVSVAVAIPAVGLLPSLSHYFYSPARDGFVGALIAASLALFALSGRNAEPVLLDAAAVVAPLIAIVPIAIASGSVPGFDDGCASPCVPETMRPSIDNGILTYLIVGAVAVVASLAIVGFTVGGMIALAALIAVGVWWGFFADSFVAWGHPVAAASFFTLIAAVALLNALPHHDDEYPPGRRLRVAYAAIAALLLLDVLALLAIVLTGAGPAWGVFAGEVAALVLFLVFWALQTAQKWGQPDPALSA